MKFLLILLLLIPFTTASDENKYKNSDKDDEKKAQTLKEIVKANTKFAFTLFQELTSQGKDSPAKNLVFSPFSISSALCMLLLGATSKTHQEIWTGLSLNNANIMEREVHQANSNLLQQLNEPKNSLQVDIGNAIFVQRTLVLLKKFEDELRSFYSAEVMKTNFNNPQEAKKKVNEYVKNKTKGKIEELVKEFSSNTKMALINYVQLKGEWEDKFNSALTRTGKFNINKNTAVEVPMMHRTGQYNTFQDTDLPCTVVELPYKDNACMIIAMAKPGKIREVEQGLSAETIQRWRTSFNKMTIALSVPKFNISSNINLMDKLPKLGIVTPFTSAANFSDITRDFALKVGSAVHQAVIKVNENGTEAAAATAIGMVPMSLPPSIAIDHPFVFFLIDKKTNSILFMGTVNNPAVQ